MRRTWFYELLSARGAPVGDATYEGPLLVVPTYNQRGERTTFTKCCF